MHTSQCMNRKLKPQVVSMFMYLQIWVWIVLALSVDLVWREKKSVDFLPHITYDLCCFQTAVQFIELFLGAGKLQNLHNGYAPWQFCGWFCDSVSQRNVIWKKSEQVDLVLVCIWREVKVKIVNEVVIYWGSAKKDKWEEVNYLGCSFSMDM